MPLPFVYDGERKRIADALEEMASLVMRIATDPDAPPPDVSLKAIADRLDAVDRLLEAGVSSGGIKPAQIRGVASQFEGVVRELRKGERRRQARRTSRAKAATSRTSKRAPARRTSSRKR